MHGLRFHLRGPRVHLPNRCRGERQEVRRELLAERTRCCKATLVRFITCPRRGGFAVLQDSGGTLHLPSHRDRFYGVEKFPPPEVERSNHENYLCADLADVDLRFECGVCIEVIEHLTPAMAAGLAAALSRVSRPGSLFLFNTGLTEYVKKEDPGYLDPFMRGHITSWSVTSARKVFEKEGFAVYSLPGKTWAFVVEKLPLPTDAPGEIRDRIWSALPVNTAMLSDPSLGSVMYILGLESARAY
jgi:hypothetical protein